MGLLSKIFGKENVRERADEPAMVYVANEDEKMSWAIEKAGLTLHYFEESVKNPSTHQDYFSVKVMIVDGDEAEYIWLTNPEFDQEGNLFGTVGNEPVNVKTVKLGQQIGVEKSLISDWMVVENGRLIGGYTIRAIRDDVHPDGRKEFDDAIGLFVDEGVDHFKVDFDTPEGAILSYEQAFNEKDIEKVVACKDFYQEARLMLLGAADFHSDEETIRGTAELLEDSFRMHMEKDGMPDFSDITSAFPKREKISEEHWVITEICTYPDGGYSEQRLSTYKTANGWRVLGLAQ